MTRKRLTVIGASLAVATAVALPATAATARPNRPPHHHKDHYPPGQVLTISAAVAAGDPTRYVVQVTGGTAGCKVRVSVNGRTAIGRVGSDGTTSVPVRVGRTSGSYTVTASTFGCDDRQSATTAIVVSAHRLVAPDSVRVRERFPVTLTGWLPGQQISVTFTDGAGHGVTVTTVTDGRGRATVRTLLSYPGDYAVVATQGDRTRTATISVLPRHRGHGRR